MRVFAIRIKLPDSVAVQGLHDADARKHRRPAVRRHQDQGFHRRLPFRRFVFRLWQFGEVGAGVFNGDELATAG